MADSDAGLGTSQNVQQSAQHQPDRKTAPAEEPHELVLGRWGQHIAIAGVCVALIGNAVMFWQTLLNKKGVDIAERGVAVSEKALDVAQAALRDSEQGARESATRADAQFALSKEALDASISSSRLDQSPWIHIPEATVRGTIGPGQAIAFSFKLANAGRSPALSVQNKVISVVRPAGAIPSIREIEKAVVSRLMWKLAMAPLPDAALGLCSKACYAAASSSRAMTSTIFS